MRSLLGVAAIGVGGYLLYKWYEDNHQVATRGSVNYEASSRPVITQTTQTVQGGMNRVTATGSSNTQTIHDNMIHGNAGGHMRGLGGIPRSTLLYSSPFRNGVRQQQNVMNYGESVIARGTNAR